MVPGSHVSDYCLTYIQSIEIAFAPNFLLAKVTRDLENRNDLFGKFNLSSLRRVNSGGEAVVSSTAVAFSKTLRNLAKNGDASFVISAGFGMTETWYVTGVHHGVCDLTGNHSALDASTTLSTS